MASAANGDSHGCAGEGLATSWMGQCGRFSARIDVALKDADLHGGCGERQQSRGYSRPGSHGNRQCRYRPGSHRLTTRVEGDYHGAFAKLKADTNSVVDNLTHVVGQLRQTSRTLKPRPANPFGRQRSGRADDQASRGDRGDFGGDGAAGEHGGRQRQARGNGERQGANRLDDRRGDGRGDGEVQAARNVFYIVGKIATIIGLIDDIAFQTNLLTLNASVEAARAATRARGSRSWPSKFDGWRNRRRAHRPRSRCSIEQSGDEVAGGSKLVAEATQTTERDAVRSEGERSPDP